MIHARRRASTAIKKFQRDKGVGSPITNAIADAHVDGIAEGARQVAYQLEQWLYAHPMQAVTTESVRAALGRIHVDVFERRHEQVTR